MNTLIVGGVTISNSLKVVAEVVGNRIYQELIEELEDLKALNERLNEETVSHEEVKAMFS